MKKTIMVLCASCLVLMGCEQGPPPLIDDALVIAETGTTDAALDPCIYDGAPSSITVDGGACGTRVASCSELPSRVRSAYRSCGAFACAYCSPLFVTFDESGCVYRMSARDGGVEPKPLPESLRCAIERLADSRWPCAASTEVRADDDACD